MKIDPATMPLGPDGKPKKIAVCACGLSSTFPICDGTHKQLNELPGHVYRYDPVTKAVIEARAEEPPTAASQVPGAASRPE